MTNECEWYTSCAEQLIIYCFIVLFVHSQGIADNEKIGPSDNVAGSDFTAKEQTLQTHQTPLQFQANAHELPALAHAHSHQQTDQRELQVHPPLYLVFAMPSLWCATLGSVTIVHRKEGAPLGSLQATT